MIFTSISISEKTRLKLKKLMVRVDILKYDDMINKLIGDFDDKKRKRS